MNSNSQIFFTLSLLLFSINLTLAARNLAVQQSDGYEPIDRNDPHVRSLAEFAVSEHNNNNMDTLNFLRVFRAQKKTLPEGTNYKLSVFVLVVNTPEISTFGLYNTIVFEGSPGTNPPMNLVSFEPVFSVFRVIPYPNVDPEVNFIAQFAVNEYISQTGKDVELVEVKLALRNIVISDLTGVTYVFLVSAKTNGEDIADYEVSVIESFAGGKPELELVYVEPLILNKRSFMDSHAKKLSKYSML